MKGSDLQISSLTFLIEFEQDRMSNRITNQDLYLKALLVPWGPLKRISGIYITCSSRHLSKWLIMTVLCLSIIRTTFVFLFLFLQSWVFGRKSSLSHCHRYHNLQPLKNKLNKIIFIEPCDCKTSSNTACSYMSYHIHCNYPLEFCK